MSKAYVIQQHLPYRGEPTLPKRVNLYKPDMAWGHLYDSDMGRPRERKKAPTWTEEEEKRLLELKKQGLSLRLIGEELGRGKDEVYRKLKKIEKKEGA